jgi:YbgC/YbaW family acyl-CoA thioester hydrolase
MANEFPIHDLHTRRRIEFADTDMGGIVHFSRYFVFMETAEHQLLEAVGTPVHFENDGREIGWPRVEAHCKWVSPARLGDELDIHVKVARKGAKSMTYEVDFRCEDRLLAQGRISSVCCVLNDPDGLKAIPIPDFIADRIAEAP